MSTVVITYYDRSDTCIPQDSHDLTDIFAAFYHNNNAQRVKSERNHWKDMERRHNRKLTLIPHKPKKEVLLWLR